MARGGFRPGAGRPKGSKDIKPRKRRKSKKTIKSKALKKSVPPPENVFTEKLKTLLEYGAKAKANIFRDLVNKLASGKELTAAETKMMMSLEKDLSSIIDESPDIDENVRQEINKSLTPLDYMLNVINNEKADAERRDKLAIAAAPFFHSKIGEKGKKQEKEDRAKKVGAGRFSASKPPKLKAVK